MVWEFVFLMVVMKIPIAYLCAVIYWAIKAEPRPAEGAGLLAPIVQPRPDPRAPTAWSPPRSRPGRRPHGSPVRTGPRHGRLARARAETRR
jgi:hypothetical protein